MSAIAQLPVENPFAELRPALTGDEALIEADRCLGCGGPYAPAPCTVACPANVDVPKFVAAVAAGDPASAATTIFAENLLGGTCARVCPVEVLCEGACVLEHEGRPPLQIAQLQRFATDAGLAESVPLREAAPANGRRVAVIGAGPAGLACAGELAVLGYAVDVYDERAEVGGLVRYAIAPYRQQAEPLPDEAAALERLGVVIHLGARVDADTLAHLRETTDALVLAIGMGEDQSADLPGSDLPGVWESLPFIERLKAGDPPDVGGRTVVVGGGNTAIDVAREALRLGSEEVTLLYRRSEAEMPAFAHEVEEARDEGIQLHLLAAPVAFHGDDRLSSIECQRMELGPPDESGRRRPQPIDEPTFFIPADTVVNAIGQRPRSEFLALFEGLQLEWGRPVVDAETGTTSLADVFAAGDLLNGGSTVVEAVRAAKAAAGGVHSSLSAEEAS